MSYAPIRTEPNTLTKPAGARRTGRRPSWVGADKKRKRSTTRPGGAVEPRPDFPIIAHCHLCWDWVWQRPQQFLSRLSERHKVLFVETIGPEPTLATPLAKYRGEKSYPNLTILRLQFPSWRWNDADYVDLERRRIVQEFVTEGPMAGHFENPVQWFYDPMTVRAFAGHMGESAIVYDCMDELANFRYAPPEIHERETALLARADVVFTGGRKLYESKRRHHDNCHFYGCGVDLEHFGKARASGTVVPAPVVSLPKPVLGYFGVIDERMDTELLAKLAEAFPAWSIAMLGPVLKIDPASLPRHKNIHWLGQQDYAALPAFCKGFDVCLMPFALNESTQFINPTKALEYMATGRMIVSSAVPDVVTNFGSVVKIAAGHEDFIGLCRKAVAAPDHAAIARGIRLAGEHSWESIVAALEEHIMEVLLQKHFAGVSA